MDKKGAVEVPRSVVCRWLEDHEVVVTLEHGPTQQFQIAAEENDTE
jgi:hypothetical protein